MSIVGYDTRSLNLRPSVISPMTRAARPAVDYIPDNSGVTAPSYYTPTTPGGTLGGALGGAIGGSTGAAIGGALGDIIIGGRSAGGAPGSGFAAGGAPVTCPDWTVRVGDRCVSPTDALPGGDPLIFDAPGSQQAGMFGLVARAPAIVGEMNNGSPIRRCPAGWVLGKDNLCYVKGGEAGIPNKLRKHPHRRPKSACDNQLAALKKAGSAAQSFKKALKGTGYTLKKGAR